MLLQRLVEYADAGDEPAPPFHRERVFHWQLQLNRDGSLASRDLTPLVAPDARGRPRGVAHTTPSAVRAYGVSANLAADDVQYVLGWSDPDSKPERVAQCHAAFVDLVTRWADSPAGRDDPVPQAVATFYRSRNIAAIQVPDGCTAKQGVVIAVGDTPAYQAGSVVPFWVEEVARRKGGGNSGLCLVCGQVRPLLDTVPGKVPSALVPGASNDAALVSINERVFGYGLEKQLTCTPLCLACGEGISTGLVKVLKSPHAVSYGNQDSRIAWWITEPVEFDPMVVVDDTDPDQVNELFRVVRDGRSAGTRPSGTFCSLSVGGNVARVMVRDWVEMPLGDLYDNLRSWLDDHEIVSRWAGGNRHHALFRLLLATGRHQRDRNRYTDLGAKGSGRPAHAHRDLLRAAIRNYPLPPSLLAHVVTRVRTDGRLDEARAALIRLGLIRSRLTTERPMPDLDPTNTDPAYVCGRLFAVLEQIQYDVSDGKLNTTYGDRYFSGAVTNPRAALVNGRRDANAWIRKLRRTKPGAAVRHDKSLDALFRLIDAGDSLPSQTSLHQQATFLIGYHHQRAHHFASIPATTPTTSEETGS